MACENNELSEQTQVFPNRFYVLKRREIVQSVGADFTKLLKALILTKKSINSDFHRKLCLFYFLYAVCNEKNTD